MSWFSNANASNNVTKELEKLQKEDSIRLYNAVVRTETKQKEKTKKKKSSFFFLFSLIIPKIVFVFIIISCFFSQMNELK